MSDISIGSAIVSAREFLWNIHTQIAVLIRSLDRQLADNGWVASSVNVTSDISPKLNSDRWMVSYLYRLYFPDPLDPFWVVGIVILLDPPEGYTAPVCLAFGAQYWMPQTHDTILKNWRHSDSVFAALRGTTTTQKLLVAQYHPFLPAAHMVSGFQMPLCSLASEDDLRILVVEPLLAIIADFKLIGDYPKRGQSSQE